MACVSFESHYSVLGPSQFRSAQICSVTADSQTYFVFTRVVIYHFNTKFFVE